LKVNETTEVVNDAHLITYADGRAASLDVFNIINYVIEDNKINWKNYIELCTDGAQSATGRTAGLTGTDKKENPLYYLGTPLCFIYRHLHLETFMNEELQSVSEAVNQNC
jgi:hypothetical protein